MSERKQAKRRQLTNIFISWMKRAMAVLAAINIATLPETVQGDPEYFQSVESLN